MPAAPPATPPPASGSPDVAVVEYDQFIDRKLRQTSWHVKAVSQTARLLIAGVGLLGFLLVAGILEHWLVRGGLSNGARWIFFISLVAAAGWYTIQFLLPFVLRRVNPIYVAQTIEEHTPGLKNSLLNLLFFRERRDEVPAPVYEALEQQAAVRMSEANVDTSADRTQLIRALSIFLVLLTIAGLYKVLSPKDLLATAGRVLMPWADIAPPTRVTIDDIKPGDAEISRGERLEITAVIQGTRDGEPVFLQYTTEDGQSVGRKIPMTPSKSGYRHVCKLPADESTRRPAGVQQGFSYRVAAGDARSKEYRVTLRDRPTIVLERVELDYPEYTGFVRDVKTPGGDLRAIEGTKVTIHAQTNQPIDEAFIDLDADGTSDVPLVVDGDQQRQAAGSFVLAMREDRRTPAQHSYVLRFRNKAGQSSRDAIRYRIDVEPDYAPEIEILAPQEEEVEVRQSETLAIEVDARDPDFALSEVKIRGAGDAVAGGEGGAKDLFDESLLTDEHVGRFWQTWRFTPKEHDLSVGDELTYWAVAKDNRRPEANVAITRRRRIRVIADPPPRDGEQQETGDRGQETGDRGQETGEKGQRADNPQQNAEGQDNQSEEPQQDDSQGEGSGQPQGKQQDGGEAGEQSESTGGQGGTDGSAQPANDQPADGQPTGEQQDQPTDGSQPAEGQPDGQGSEEKRPNGQPGNSGTENQPNAQPDPTASDGSDDGTAFETIRRHMEEKETGERQETGEPPSRTADGVREPGEGQREPSDGQREPGDSQRKPAEGQREPSEDEPEPADAAPKPGDDSPQPEIPDNEPQPTDAPENADPPQPNEPQDGPGREGAAEDRQSEGTGAETKSGEHAGDQEQSRGQQEPKSPGGEQTSPKGESGAGQQPNESQGAPSGEDPSVQQRDKQMKESPGQRKDDQEPPAGLQKNKDQKDSDSEGDQGGDKPGGGQEGGGQKANDAGTGSAGQNQAADEGAGKAADPGQGETGDQPGEKETADSKTGKSDGQQKGPGSKSQPGGEKETGDRGQETGDRGQETGDREQETGDREQETGDREQETESPSSRTADGVREPAESQPEPANDERQPDESPPEPGEPNQRPPAGQPESTSGGAPTGSGTPGASRPGRGTDTNDDSPPADGNFAGDKANLDYARKQTDLILDRLSDQVDKREVDQELLDELGWSEDDLRRFLDRWNARKQAARGNTDTAKAARRELDAALRSLGLGRQPLRRPGAAGARDNLRELRSAPRAKTPPEFQRQLQAYTRDVAKGRSDETDE